MDPDTFKGSGLHPPGGREGGGCSYYEVNIKLTLPTNFSNLKAYERRSLLHCDQEALMAALWLISLPSTRLSARPARERAPTGDPYVKPAEGCVWTFLRDTGETSPHSIPKATKNNTARQKSSGQRPWKRRLRSSKEGLRNYPASPFLGTARYSLCVRKTRQHS